MKVLSKGKTMTVKEVAEVLGVTTEAIKWNIRKIYPDLMVNGKVTHLTELQVVEIKKNMMPTSQLVAATTDIEMITKTYHVMEWLKGKYNESQKVVEEMKPKAEFFDQVTSSEYTIDIGSAAKVLNMGVGRNRLFAILRARCVLMDNNQPYQRFIDGGHFRTIEQKYTKPNGSTSINIKTVVYQKGLDYIRKTMSVKEGICNGR